MHTRNSRIAALFAGALLLFAGVTCTESPTGPQSGHGLSALVGFAPSFSKAATEVYQRLVGFGLAVDNIYVHLVHENGTLLKDTTVFFSPGQTEVAIDIPVVLNAPTENLRADIELRDGSTVLFSGTQTIPAVAGGAPSTPPAVTLEYTGPDATVTNFSIAPNDTTIAAGDNFTFRPSASDQNEQPVTNLIVTWSVQDPARGSVDGQGKFTATQGGSRGATNVTASLLNGITATAQVHIVPPATQIVVVSGGSQTGTVGKALSQAITVEARAADNLPVPGAHLTFQVTGGGGQVSPTTAIADANGRASVTLTLGTIAGANSIEAGGTGITPLTVSATGTADVPAKLVIVQQPSTTSASGAALPTQPKAQLQDQYGNPVALPNVAVTAALTAPNSAGQTLGGTVTVNTNSSGVAEFTNLEIAGPAGTATLTFSGSTLTSAVSGAIAVGAGAAHHLAIVQQPSATSASGAVLATQPTAQLLDEFGNVVAAANVAVTAALSAPNSAGQTLGGTVTVNTNSSGVAVFTDLAISGPIGTATLTLNAPAIANAVSSAIAVGHGTAHHLGFVQQPANGTGGTVLAPITVEVLDPFGNRVTTGTGATTGITLALAGGATGALLGPTTAALTQSAEVGLATFNVSVDKAAMGYSLSASAGTPIVAATSSTFNIAVGPPAVVIAVSGDEQGALPNTALLNALTVKVLDAGSNPVPTTNVTFAVTSGGGSVMAGGSTGPSVVVPTTTPNGTASVNWSVGSGTQVVTATVGSAPSLDLHAYIAEMLVLETQPPLNPPSGVLFPSPLSVHLSDSAGHQVKRAGVTIGVDRVYFPTPLELFVGVIGTTSATTNALGVASFPVLGLEGRIEQHVKLKFFRFDGEAIDPNIAPALSAEIALQPGFPSQVLAPGGVERHRLPAPAHKTLDFIVRDGYNAVPGVPMAFDVLQGAANCSLIPSAATSDALGNVSVDVTAPNDLSSCVVRAHVDMAPPPSGPVQLVQRLYVAADPVRIWTGQQTADFSFGSGNWFDGIGPGATSPVFVPGASFYGNPNVPTIGSATSILSLLIESDASLNLNNQTLLLADRLAAKGPIDGGGTVVMNSTSEVHLVSGTVHALLRFCEDTAHVTGSYVVDDTLAAQSMAISCPLALATATDVSVAEDLVVAGPSAQFAQTDGHIVVGKNLTVTSGAVVVNSRGFMSVVDGLNVGPAANLSQGGGYIVVGGDARLDGSQSLTDGTLELKKNFVHNGNCETQTIFATDPHVTQFTGTADLQTITWNTGCASRFGTLELRTSGANGVKLIADPIFSAPPVYVNKLIIRDRSILDMQSNFIINVDSPSGSLLIEAGGELRLQGTIAPFALCSPEQPDGLIQGMTYRGLLSCSFPPS